MCFKAEGQRYRWPSVFLFASDLPALKVEPVVLCSPKAYEHIAIWAKTRVVVVVHIVIVHPA